MRIWQLACLAVLLALACGEEANDNLQSSTRTVHQRMVDTLAALSEAADPMQLYHLNARRAASIKSRLDATTDPTQRFQLSYEYATELLSSGQLAESIQFLEQITAQLPLQANTKPFYDLLAVGHLRRGEVSNCLGNHNEESCIVPITGGGIHIDPSGSEAAIKSFTQLLEAFPDDHQTRYLLNLAYQTLGREVPAHYRIKGLFAPVGERQFVDRAGHGALGVDRLSGGVALGDFNGDGYTDIFATSYGFADDARLFLSQEGGGFTEADANLEGIRGGLNCQAADYDNDGDLDVLVLRGGWFGAAGAFPNSLLQNDGSGRFTDVTLDAGLAAGRATQTAAWADFDLDGDLDLFIGNEASDALRSPCELYINNGAGTFTEQAAAAGVNLIAVAKGATAGDVNGDGWPDIYVSCLGQGNELFINQGLTDGVPLFVKTSIEAGVTQPIFSFPTWMFDYDQDGDLDLFVSGYDVSRQTDAAGVEARVRLGLPDDSAPLKLYENNGSGRFADVSAKAGINRPAFTMGSNYGDLTGDGFPEMYLGTGVPDLRSVVPNLYYVNDRGQGFRENTLASGLGHVQKGHGVGMADFDGDGDLDIYTVLGGAFEGDNFPNALFENRLPGGHAWLSLELEGVQANRSAIGARIEVLAKAANGQPITRYHTINTGGSFGGNSLAAFIGLGEASAIEQVTIQWPSQLGAQQVVEGLTINQAYRIRQGEPAVAIVRKSRPMQGAAQHAGHAHH